MITLSAMFVSEPKITVTLHVQEIGNAYRKVITTFSDVLSEHIYQAEWVFWLTSGSWT